MHTYSRRNPPVNRTLAAGATLELTFPYAERSCALACDVHPWLQAWVQVIDSPFWAVTGADGRFSIPGLSPGDHEVRVLHGTLAHARVLIDLAAGESQSLEVVLEP